MNRKMIFIPAIDLIEGRCVRLLQGDYSKKIQYSRDPVEVAQFFQDEGVEFIHVVDLEAAKDGSKRNLKVIEKIVQAVKIPVEVGGGIREKKRASILMEMGVSRVILGTLIVKDELLACELVEEYGNRLAAGIDARKGIVKLSGWQVDSDIKAIELAKKVKDMGFHLIIYTDILRDGTMEGPNLKEIEEMARVSGIPIIASGGVSGIGDLLALKPLEKMGVLGVISGRAIYEGRLSVREACRVLKGYRKG